LSIGQRPQELTAVLSIFAVASIRMFPATSALLSGIITVRTSKYIVDKIYLDLKEVEGKEKSDRKFSDVSSPGKNNRAPQLDRKPMAFLTEVVLSQISYSYPEATKPSVQNICLTLKRGQAIALIGKSGAGKTTLVDVILGLLRPQAGDLTVDGVSVYDDLRQWQNLIGYIPQSIFLMDDTLERNIAFGVPDEQIDTARLLKAIEAAQLSQLVDELADGINTQLGERGVRLSGGQRQRIGIARALYHEREILVLDEATAALDNETERLVNDSIKALSGQKTLIIIAHRLTTVKHCDRIYLMEQGKISKEGSYAEIVLGESTVVQ
jgi:ATP-binding cassette, subfamily B, bacterial PglK